MFAHTLRGYTGTFIFIIMIIEAIEVLVKLKMQYLD